MIDPMARAATKSDVFNAIAEPQRRDIVALVRAGAVFKNGKLIERPDESEGGDQQVA